jgi:hypothetical protein
MAKQYVMTFSEEEISALHGQLVEARAGLERTLDNAMSMTLDEDGEEDSRYAETYAPIAAWADQMLEQNYKIRKKVEHARG